MEERLYSGEHEDMVSAAYPAFLVLASSGLGIALTARLSQAGRIGEIATWGLHCIYASKLAMLLVPQVRHLHRTWEWTSTSGGVTLAGLDSEPV